MSYESAAEAMRVSVKAVESLLHRAKANLREALRDYA
jgi:DNA-directed RNA polymerase specialized sigma24 family protein